MSDDQRAQAELSDIELALSSIDMQPAAQTRERLLYACGHAAGRAQAMRGMRLTAAAATVMMCVSTGLAWRLATLPAAHDAPRMVASAPTGDQPIAGPSIDTREPSATPPMAGIPDERLHWGAGFDEALSSTLRVGDSLDRIAALDARAAARVTTISPQAVHAQREQILTPASLHRAEIEWD